MQGLFSRPKRTFPTRHVRNRTAQLVQKDTRARDKFSVFSCATDHASVDAEHNYLANSCKHSSFLSLRHVAIDGRMLSPSRCPARCPAQAEWHAFRGVRRTPRVAPRARWSVTTVQGDASEPVAHDVIRAPTGKHIYFAYGSNVNTKTMTGVRGITPSKSYPAVLYGYKLVFNVPGLPFVEPAFASVMKISGDEHTKINDAFARYERETHGVAYEMTDTEWQYLLRTETSYVCEDVLLEMYVEGGRGESHGMSDGIMGDEGQTSKKSIQATTLVFPDMDVGGVGLLPSQRYLDLLREGASEWNLDGGWRDYLENKVKAYDPDASVGKRAGGVAAALSFAPLVAAAAPLVAGASLTSVFEAMNKGNSTGSSDPANIKPEEIVETAVAEGFRTFSKVTWGVHNLLWAPVFGSGANNEDK